MRQQKPKQHCPYIPQAVHLQLRREPFSFSDGFASPLATLVPTCWKELEKTKLEHWLPAGAASPNKTIGRRH
jgi:hypothetical protein